MSSHTEVVERLSAACAAGGYDVVAPFNVRQWSAQDHVLPEVGRDDALGVLIGNTRALWQHVRSACEVREAKPIDTHTERVVTQAARDVCGDARWTAVWAHSVSPAFPMQRLAAAVGLATLSPSQLAIHPEHGPWWALRAVVVGGVQGPKDEQPAIDLCGPCDKPCLAPFERARGTHDWRVWLEVRDACPVGRSQRYGDEQIIYHYESAFSLNK
jgi:methylmalonic aciduria homocystinuria type C protein